MQLLVVTPYFTSISSIDKVSTMGLQVMPLPEQSKWYHGSSMLGCQKCVPPQLNKILSTPPASQVKRLPAPSTSILSCVQPRKSTPSQLESDQFCKLHTVITGSYKTIRRNGPTVQVLKLGDGRSTGWCSQLMQVREGRVHERYKGFRNQHATQVSQRSLG